MKEFWPTEIFQELCYLGTRELYNMRFYHTYIDEDMIGTMKGLCRRVHRRMLELRVLLRWMIRLKTHVIKAPRWFGKKSWSEHMCLGWGFGWVSDGFRRALIYVAVFWVRRVNLVQCYEENTHFRMLLYAAHFGASGYTHTWNSIGEFPVS